jgi:hypothetical protein
MAAPPNKGLELTAYSVRSCLAPLPAAAQARVSQLMTGARVFWLLCLCGIAI